jgi:hypothetical protein
MIPYKINFSSFVDEFVKISQVSNDTSPSSQDYTAPAVQAAGGALAGLASKRMGRHFSDAIHKNSVRNTDLDDYDLRQKVVKESPVPVHSTFDFEPDLSDSPLWKNKSVEEQLARKKGIKDAIAASLGFHARRSPNDGIKTDAVFYGSPAPEIVAHEIGHAKIDQSKPGRFLQSLGLRTHRLSNNLGISAAAGLLSSESDNPTIRRLGAWSPALLGLPHLGYEAGASVIAMRDLKRLGASPAQLAAARKTLLPAFGTYAAGVAKNVGAAHLSQAAGSALRKKFEKAKSEEPVTESKTAEEYRKRPGLEMSKAIGAGTLGFGAGTAGGLLAGHGADLLAQKFTGKKLPKSVIYGASPLLGGTAGIAYAVYKAKEQEAIRRALEDSTKSGPG